MTGLQEFTYGGEGAVGEILKDDSKNPRENLFPSY
jgi:hypothetical protein